MINWNELTGSVQWNSDENEPHAYNDLAFGLILQEEGSEALPYLDTAAEHYPTIGIGFNLTSNPVRLAVLDAMGLGDANAATYRAQIATLVGQTWSSDAALRTALDNVIAQAHANGLTDQTSFQLDAAQIQQAFPAVALQKEADVDGWLADIPASRERTALLSLAYNTRFGETNLLGAHLKAAIEDGNRAEAWYEIRYNSNLH